MRLSAYSVIIALSLIMAVGAWSARPLLDRWEHLSIDGRQAFRFAANAGWRGDDERVRPDLVSDEVCLIGIDDRTLRYLGKWGSGSWIVRDPFFRMVPVLQGHFAPSVVAFDILFRPPEGLEWQGNVQELTAAAEDDMREYRQVIEALSTASREGVAAISNQILLLMTKIAAQQGDTNLAVDFSELRDPSSTVYAKAVPVVCGYDFVGLDSPSEARWSRADILGNDPDDLSEENGEAIPYLRDVEIPAKQIRGLPSDYRFLHYASLAAKVLRDCSQHGFINVPRDPDGQIRRIPLVLGFRFRNPLTQKTTQVFVPSFCLLSVLHHWRLTASAVEVNFGRDLVVRRKDGQVAARIPIDAGGRMFINYTGRVRNFPTLSLYDFLDLGRFDVAMRRGETPKSMTPEDARVLQDALGRVKSKIAMVGLTATGTTDVGPCPVDPLTPYVHVHMTAASNILTGEFLRPPGVREFLQAFLAVVLIYTWFSCRLGVFPLTLSTAALLLTYVAFSYVLVYLSIAVIPVVAPVLYVGATFLAVIVYRYLTEERGRKKVRGMFSRMVSPEVLKYMEENPQSFSLTGQRVEATIMFSDVAGFTSISERLTPEKLTQLLNEYLSAMSDIILRSGGYVDKYEGDAIMAVWGVPYSTPQHAEVGCLAALEQQAELARIRPILQSRYGVPMHARLGMNSGSVIAGNMGSAQKFQYTVMGDTVNQAARFEPANKDYGTLIMIGQNTYELAGKAVAVRMLDKIVVMGKTEPARIYELLGRAGEVSPEMQRVVDRYEEALRLHWDRHWDEALKALEDALSVRAEDKPSLNLRERICSYQQNPPPDSWQGEFARRHKD